MKPAEPTANPGRQPEDRDRGMPRIPFPVRVSLRLLLNARARRSVMSDLSELYQVRWERDGEAAARAWLRRQTRLYPFMLIGAHLRRHEPTHESRLATHPPPTEHLRTVARDLRHSLRSLARTPVLTATIVLTVGLGIGATTAIFSVIDAVLIRPLPYANAHRLYRIYTDSPPNRWPFSVADYLALDEQQTSFDGIAAYWTRTFTFNRDDIAERVSGMFVSWTYFPLLGVSPLHGRGFDRSDAVPGTDNRVIVSHRFWNRHLDGNPGAVGDPIRLNGGNYTVVGVLPPVVGPLEHDRDLFVVARFEPPPRKGPFFIRAIARISDAATPAAAADELRAINRRMFPVWQASYQDQRASWRMLDLKEFIVGDVGVTLTIVLGAVGFVLLIASTNAANLLVARATHRSRELAVRAALGASRSRLLQHLVSESLLLAVCGALLGIVLTWSGIKLVTTFGTDFIPRTSEIGLNSSVIWFLATLTAGSAALFGLIPALHSSNPRFDLAWRSGGRRATAGRGARRLRRTLVVSQFAVAAPLLIGAGLLMGSLAKLRRVDPGFDTGGILTAAISLPAGAYPDSSAIRAFWDAAHTGIATLPGVRSVAFADGRPTNAVATINNFDLLDDPTPPNESQPATPWVAVTPEYFELLSLPALEGRLFDERDTRAGFATPVAVVDQAWARRFFPDESAVGRQFLSGGCTGEQCPRWTVVGVVSDVKHMGLDSEDEGTVYYPIPPTAFRFRYLFVRTEVDPITLTPSIRQIVRELDPTLPLANLATMDQLVANSLEEPRYLTILVSTFASVALLLSVIGIYGVMSYFVQQHMRDIGIRIALGGGPSNVLAMVVRNGMRLVAVGTALGVVAALALTRYMSTLLFEVGATDAMTFGVVSLGMLGTAAIACLVPARRAAGLDPATTLREE